MRAAFVAVVAIVFGVSVAEASHLAEQPKKHRIVYHLDEASIDKTKFALGNLENHVKGVGGIANVEAMELVVHGPALRHFVTVGMDQGVKEALERLQAQGLVLGACGNTMRGLSITLDQLPRGATPLPQGGVVRIMELQERGYVYIRP